MLVECSNCGAPLDVRSRAVFTKCSYCGVSSRVRSLQTLAMESPSHWQPPREWSPPPHVKTPSGAPLPYKPRSGSGLGCVITMITLGTALIPLVFTLKSLGLISPASVPAALGGWDGESPFECGANDTVELKGHTVVFDGRTAFTAGGNCDLRIVECDVTAYTGVEAGGNRGVTIEDSVFRTVGPAIVANGNRRVEIVNSRLISSEGVGIEAGGNVRVIISGGHVEGTPVAVQTRANGRLEHRTGEVVNRSGPAGSPSGSGDATPYSDAEIDPVVHRRKSQFVRCFERNRHAREQGASTTVEGRHSGKRPRDLHAPTRFDRG